MAFTSRTICGQVHLASDLRNVNPLIQLFHL